MMSKEDNNKKQISKKMLSVIMAGSMAMWNIPVKNYGIVKADDALSATQGEDNSEDVVEDEVVKEDTVNDDVTNEENEISKEDSEEDKKDDEVIKSLQERIDKLPTSEEFEAKSKDEQEKAYNEAIKVYEIYSNTLTDEQREKINAEKLNSLLEYFNNQIALLDEGNDDPENSNAISGTISGTLSGSGNEFTLSDDAEVPQGETLTIAEGQTLTIPSGKTLTVNGTLINNGTLDNQTGGILTNNGILLTKSTLTNNGQLTNNGTLTVEDTDGVLDASYSSAITGSGTLSGSGQFKISNVTSGVTQGDITLPQDLSYDGQDKTQQVKDTIKITKEVQGKTFTVEAEYNISPETVKNAGTYQISSPTLGQNIASFEVSQKSISDVTVEGVESEYAYSGSKIEPIVTAVKDGNTTLEKETDYTISYGDNIWDSGVNEQQGKVIILGKGNYSGSKEVTFKMLPTGSIEITDISDGGFKSFINKITFGYFFKEEQTVTINVSSDMQSSVTIKYHVANEDLFGEDKTYTSEEIEEKITSWNEYENPFTLQKDNKYVVYAKITDKADNSTYISSNGIVIYTDSLGNTESVNYTKFSNESKEVKVTLNSNEIAKINDDSKDLIKGTDYTVSDGTITLTYQYLNTLSVGNHTLTVSYNPLGEEYKDGFAPNNTTFEVNVERATPRENDFTFTKPSDLKYNGSGKEAKVTAKQGIEGMGDITVKYYDSKGDKLESAPVDIGEYTVKIDVAEEVNYESATDITDETWKFNIEKATPSENNFNFKKPSDLKYNGSSKEVTVTAKEGIEGMGDITVKYYDSTGSKLESPPVDAGEYTVKIDVTEGNIYESATDVTGDSWKFEITKASHDVLEEPTAGEIVYGSKLSESTLPSGWKWADENLIPSVGQSVQYMAYYTVDDANYDWSGYEGYNSEKHRVEKMVNVKVTPYDVSNDENVKVSSDSDEYIYDAKVWSPEITVKKDENVLLKDTDYQVTLPSDMTSVGEKNISVNFKGNYTGVKNIKLNVKYLEAPSNPYTIEGDYKSNGTVFIKDGNKATIKPETGYSISGILNGDYSEKLEISESKESGTVKIYLKNTSGQMTDAINVSESVKKDVTPPSGSISISSLEQNAFEKFMNKITFGYFYKEAQEVTISASDAESGVKQIEYYVSNEDLFTEDKTYTSEEIETKITSWSKYENPVKLAKDNKYVVYAKITDNIGYTSYINSQGIVIYTDAVSKTTNVNYTKLSKEDKQAEVVLNGNEIAKINDGSKNLVKDTDYTVSGGTITLKNSYLETLTVGDHTLTVSYKVQGEEFVNGVSVGNAPSDTTITVTVDVNKSTWGKEVNNNGVVNYVSDDGTTSAEISDNDITWLKEESDGTSAWYAIDNSEGVFEKGSRFSVRWVKNSESKSDWDKYYALMDEEHKNKVDSERLWIFLAEVTAPNGNKYTQFSKSVPFYIELGEDWDKDEVKAIFIKEGEDEIISLESLSGFAYPAGQGEFAKLKLNHFSPYAIYDNLTDEEKKALDSSKGGSSEEDESGLNISTVSANTSSKDVTQQSSSSSESNVVSKSSESESSTEENATSSENSQSESSDKNETSQSSKTGVEDSQKTDNKKLPWIISSLAALAAIIGGVIYALKKKGKK